MTTRTNTVNGTAPIDPHAAPDAERLLVALYVSYSADVYNDSFFREARGLEPPDFRAREHRLIWQAVRNLEDRGQPVSVVSVEDELERAALLESRILERGDVLALVTSLALDPGFMTYHAPGYAQTVKTAADARAGEKALENALGVMSDTTIVDPAERRDLVRRALNPWLTRSTLAPEPRFRLLSPADLRAQADVPDVVRGLVALDSLFGVVGRYSSFKSFVLLDMLLSVSAGMTWAGLDTYPGAVVYVCGEGQSKVKRRLDAWSIARGVDIDALPIKVLSDMPRLMDDADVTALIDVIAPWRSPVIVAFDTLARVLTGGDENSARDMGIVVNNMERVRKATGAAVGYVHHQGHTEARSRGSSALPAAIDTELSLERAGDLVTVKVTKQKDADIDVPLTFRAVKVELPYTDYYGQTATSLVMDHAGGAVVHRTPDQVIDDGVLGYVKAHPGETEYAIRKALPIPAMNENDVRRALSRLLLSGKVRTEDGARNAKCYHPVTW